MSMYKAQQSNNQLPLEQFYEILSSLLTTTKKILITFQKAFKSNLQLDTQLIRQIINQQKYILTKLPSIITKNLQMDTNRFISRIIEVLEVFKNKYSQIPRYQFLSSLVRDIESTANTYSLDRNITRIFNNIIRINQKYLKKIQDIQQISLEFIFQQDHKPQKESLRNIKNHNQVILPKLDKQASKSQYVLAKLLDSIGKSYLTLNLDLDFTYYKSSFMRSKNVEGNQGLEEEMFERNQGTLRQINKYSKDFKEYLNRRQIRRTNARKNRIIQRNRQNASISPKVSQDFPMTDLRTAKKADFISRKTTNRLSKAYTIHQNTEEKQMEEEVCLNKKTLNLQGQKTNLDIDIQTPIGNSSSYDKRKNQIPYNKYNKNCYIMNKVEIGTKISFHKNPSNKIPKKKGVKLANNFKTPQGEKDNLDNKFNKYKNANIYDPSQRTVIQKSNLKNNQILDQYLFSNQNPIKKKHHSLKIQDELLLNFSNKFRI